MNARDIDEEADDLQRRVYAIGQRLVEIGWATGAYANREGGRIQLTPVGKAELAKILEIAAPLAPVLKDHFDWGALYFILDCTPGLGPPKA